MKILDHGYLELVEHWGSDVAVIEAARMSTSKGFLGWGPKHELDCLMGQREGRSCVCEPKPGDEKLLRYLWENQHATPFEMAGATFEVKAPIAVFREWHRHRVPFGYSEVSARYVPLPDENYVPTVERVVEGSKKTANRQASSVSGECSEADAENWLHRLSGFYEIAEQMYQRGLSRGVPKELARLCVPVGRYSKMRATGNLRGWLAFLKLREAPNAQWEIRQYAAAVGQLLTERFPRTMELFREPTPEQKRIDELEAALREARSAFLRVDYPLAVEACDRVLK